jgi:malate synthase
MIPFPRFIDPVQQAQAQPVIQGECTVAGLRQNLRVGIRALEAWLQGQEASSFGPLLAEAALAESCRVQVWHWLRGEAVLEDGERLSPSLFHGWVLEALAQIGAEVGLPAFLEGHYREASELFEALVLDPVSTPISTVPAVGHLLQPATLEVTA